MIDTREALLAAVRKAELTPTGITVGPLAFVGGGHLCLGAVRDEQTRRQLLTKIMLASSKYFKPDTQWAIPHVRQERNPKAGKGQRRKKPGRK